MAATRYAIYRQWGMGAPAFYGAKGPGMVGRRNGRHAPAIYPAGKAQRLAARMNGLARAALGDTPWFYAAYPID